MTATKPPLTEDQILDLIDEWHQGAGEGLMLHHYLGLTFKQYAAWVEDQRNWWEAK